MMNTRAVSILCVALLIAQRPYAFPLQPQAGTSKDQSKLTAAQLDSLVAPIALYPDPILSQTLVASTYPLEIVEAGRWLKQHSHLKGKELADAAAKQSWDASVQALVLLPDVLNRLDQNVAWTGDLGNAFLAQEQDVMNAVQRLRKRASDEGALKSTKEQTVGTTAENGQTYIEIQPASPEVVYVPQYNPVAVWGPPPAYYPYPPIYYPPVPSTGAIVAASAISFGAGLAVGAIWGGGWGGWGWGAGWGGGNVVVNNNFIRNNHFNRANVGNGNRWVHNPEHRRGMAYNNRDVANRFQGANRPNRPTNGNLGQGGRGQGIGRGNVGQGGGRGPGQGNLGQGGRGQGVGRGNLGQNGGGGPAQGNLGQGGRGALGPGQGSAARLGPGAGNRNPGAISNRGSASRSIGGGAPGSGGFNRGGGGFNRGGGGFNRGGGGFNRGGGGGARRGGGGGGAHRGGGGGARRGGGGRRR